MNKYLAASQAASRAAQAFTGVEAPYRYYWHDMCRPWYWVFTFWHERWRLPYGEFEVVRPGEPGYDEAPYEVGMIVDRHAHTFDVANR